MVADRRLGANRVGEAPEGHALRGLLSARLSDARIGGRLSARDRWDRHVTRWWPLRSRRG